MHNANHLDQLRERIELLEKRAKETDAKIEQVAKTALGMAKLINEHLREHEGELTDLFERMKSIELHLFPNLKNDIAKLIGIVGDDPSMIVNPLDRKKL